jgi:hypothetical protein
VTDCQWGIGHKSWAMGRGTPAAQRVVGGAVGGMGLGEGAAWRGAAFGVSEVDRLLEGVFLGGGCSVGVAIEGLALGLGAFPLIVG